MTGQDLGEFWREGNDATREGFAQIAKFNVAARYEDYKDDLRRQATAEYTNAWLEKTNALRKLLAGEYHARS